MKKTLIAAGIVLLSSAFSCYAVDGYKDIKFGSTLSQVKASKICNLEVFSDSNDVAGMTQYYCGNFPFSGTKTTAMFFFIDGKFQRLAIALNGNINGVYNALKAKYGEPSSQSSMDEVEKMNENGGAVTIKFDYDSIIMAQTKDSVSSIDSNQLIYNSPSYQKQYESLQKNAASNDI